MRSAGRLSSPRAVHRRGICASLWWAGVVSGLLCCPGSMASQPDFAAASSEALGYLKTYLQIDTTNPPGNEAKGAEFLARVLKENGIEPQLFETAPGRSCVYARLKGNGKKKAVILLNHIDVVPARAEDWKHPPFSGVEVDGEVWGRGALDMKGVGVAELEAMLLLKRSGAELDRDVIFLATPDEELSGRFGAGWFVEHHGQLVKDAEFLFNEGAFIDTTVDGKVNYWGVAVSEKSVLWLNLTAKGEAGHGSMPIADSAVNRLVRSMTRLLDDPPPPMILPAVREYFANVSKTAEGRQKELFADIDATVKQPESYQELLKDKMKSSMVRNTISPTVLKAGYKTNVIPAEAEAELDCRLLPGVKSETFIEQVKERLKDSGIEIKVLDWVHTDASPHNTEAFSAITKVAGETMPGVPVVPMVMPWFTDSHWFRDLGVSAYGFVPFRVDPQHLATVHGKNERVSVKGFAEGVELLYKVMVKLCAADANRQ